MVEEMGMATTKKWKWRCRAKKLKAGKEKKRKCIKTEYNASCWVYVRGGMGMIEMDYITPAKLVFYLSQD